MKRSIFFLFFSCVHLFLSAESTIVESDNITVMRDYITPSTLVVFDIDNTVLRTTTMLGSPPWFSHEYEKQLSIGAPHNEALDHARYLWKEVHDFVGVEAVQENTVEEIHSHMQHAGDVIGLTNRDEALVEQSLLQLHSLNVSFKEHGFAAFDEKLDDHPLFVWKEGILFCKKNTNKRGVFAAFAEAVKLNDFPYDRILFIDDSARNIVLVEEAVEGLGLEYVGIRYSHEDKRTSSFDGVVADLQKEFFLMRRVIPDHLVEALAEQS